MDGLAAAPPRPSELWTSPRPSNALLTEDDSVSGPAQRAPLSLADVVDMALRNSPLTRASWREAQAAADRLGASRGLLYPDINGAVTTGLSRSTTANNSAERTQLSPTVSLNYLLFDFGGRSGAIESARASAYAAGFAHNAAVQSAVLSAESSAFAYLAARAVRDAQLSAVRDAESILAAAEERHRVGVATIADVYQARTARAQEALALETFEGAVNVARGALAVAMGLPATTPIELANIAPADTHTVTMTTVSVDSIVALAVRQNPALAAARADAMRAQAAVSVARSFTRPSLRLGATGGYVASNRENIEGRNYSLSLGLSIPIFSGFSNEYNVRAAANDFAAAAARATAVQRDVELQVFTSYYAFQTATRRVRSTAELLETAIASEGVARGRYTEGVGGIVDLLLAQSALAEARAQSLAAGWEWRTALAQLAYDAGALGLNGAPLGPLSDIGSR
jgi:outer membrane protein TolC